MPLSSAPDTQPTPPATPPAPPTKSPKPPPASPKAADAAAAAYAVTTDLETAAEYVFFAVRDAACGAADYADERKWQGQRLFELINEL